MRLNLTELIRSVSVGSGHRGRHTPRAVEAGHNGAGTVYWSRHAAATRPAAPAAEAAAGHDDRPQAGPTESRLRISPAVQAAVGCRLCGHAVSGGWCTSAVCGAAQ